MDVSFANEDLESVITQQLASLGSLIDDKKLKVEIAARHDDGLVAYFDSKLITQVVVNLLSNAIKFSPLEGRLIIDYGTKPAMRNGFKQPVAYFSLTDEGIGIPAAEVKSIFDRFVEGSHTRSKSGGTGLGLTISHEIIKLHGGVIWAESPPQNAEKGTRMEFQIPLSTSQGELVQLEWTAESSVGIPVLDRHHKKIFAIINQLIETPELAVNDDDFHRHLMELNHYVEYHLKYEEDLFSKSGYPFSLEHKLKHESFIENLSMLSLHVSRKDPMAKQQLLTFLIEWWQEHIMHEDKKYAAHLFDYLYGESSPAA